MNGKDVYFFHPSIRFARDVILFLLLLKEDKEASIYLGPVEQYFANRGRTTNMRIFLHAVKLPNSFTEILVGKPSKTFFFSFCPRLMRTLFSLVPF